MQSEVRIWREVHSLNIIFTAYLRWSAARTLVFAIYMYPPPHIYIHARPYKFGCLKRTHVTLHVCVRVNVRECVCCVWESEDPRSASELFSRPKRREIWQNYMRARCGADGVMKIGLMLVWGARDG